MRSWVVYGSVKKAYASCRTGLAIVLSCLVCSGALGDAAAAVVPASLVGRPGVTLQREMALSSIKVKR